jgi:hypothetical protein
MQEENGGMMMMTRNRFTPQPLLDPAEFAIERIDLQPRYAEAMAELQKYESRLAETRARRERLSAALRVAGAGNAAAPTLTADQLLAGASEPGYNTEGEFAACENEEITLRKKIGDLAQKIADITGDLSFEICTRFRDENAANYHAMLDAMVALQDALQASTGLHARLQAAGYRINETAMPSFMPWGVVRALNDYGGCPEGVISRLRAFIEERLS